MENITAAIVPRYAQGRTAIALLLLRLVVGLAFVLHGYPKIQHATSWMTAAMGARAFAPPWLQAVAAAVEFFGGLALILGLFTPIAVTLIAINMLVALFGVELPAGDSFVAKYNSYELSVVYLVTMAALYLTGPGSISLDALLLRRPRAARPAAGAS